MSSRSTITALFLHTVILAALARVSPAAAHLGCRTSVAGKPQTNGLCAKDLKLIRHHFLRNSYDEEMIEVEVAVLELFTYINQVIFTPRGKFKPPSGGKTPSII